MKTIIGYLLFGAIALATAHHNFEHHDRPHARPPMAPHPDMPSEFKELLEDLKDFMKLYPRREIMQIIRQHWHDEELQAVVAFVRSPQFKEIVHTIVETPEFKNIANYLETANWPWTVSKAAEHVARLLEFMGRSLESIEQRGGGLNGLLDDIIAILPSEELRALFEDKMENRPVFASVVRIMSSDEMKELVMAAFQSEVISTQLGLLQENGIDVSKLIDYQKALLGF